MSKSSRRSSRSPGTRSTGAPGSPRPTGLPAADSSSGGATIDIPAGGSGIGTALSPGVDGSPGVTGSGDSSGRAAASSSPSGRARAGRRDRPRASLKPRPFYVRYRSQLIGAGISVFVLAVIAVAFLGSTAKAYSCTSLLTPAPAASVAPNGSPILGQSQGDMGNTHVAVGDSQVYVSCPPASGNHYLATDAGPIPPRYYGPDDPTIPQGWVHNLEHGGLVVLYTCNGGCPDDATLARLKTFATVGFPNSPVCDFPAGVVSPVVTRFDDMTTKFAALVWDRVLMQETLDTNAMLKFYAQDGEQFNPEPLCGASPSPS